MRFFEDILATVGDTPLVRLNSVTKGLKPLVLAKLESFNPGKSNKDRVGIHIVEMAEKDGTLKPGGTIVEATSGNTGLGLALAAVVKGYKCICVMPDKVGQEKRDLLKAHGARVVITPTSAPPGSPERYTEVAKRIAAETPGGFLANQYFNPHNRGIHYLTTGPEIWRDTEGRVTCYVASLGTGGSTSGAGRYLKEQNPAVRVVGVEPVGSILGEFQRTGKIVDSAPYLVEGIGQEIIPGNVEFQYIDEILTVTDRESFHLMRRLSREEGIFVGGSSGTALAGALKVAERMTAEDVRRRHAAGHGRALPEQVPQRRLARGPWDARRRGDARRRPAAPEGRRKRPAGSPHPEAGRTRCARHSRSSAGTTSRSCPSCRLRERSSAPSSSRTSSRPSSRAARRPTPPFRPRWRRRCRGCRSDEPVAAATRILTSAHALLVEEKGRPVGILTRIDVIGFGSR